MTSRTWVLTLTLLLFITKPFKAAGQDVIIPPPCVVSMEAVYEGESVHDPYAKKVLLKVAASKNTLCGDGAIAVAISGRGDCSTTKLSYSPPVLVLSPTPGNVASGIVEIEAVGGEGGACGFRANLTCPYGDGFCTKHVEFMDSSFFHSFPSVAE